MPPGPLLPGPPPSAPDPRPPRRGSRPALAWPAARRRGRHRPRLRAAAPCASGPPW